MRLVWWLATVFAISLVSIGLSERGNLSMLRNLSLTANAPVQSGLRDVASPVSNFVTGITDRANLSEENEQLRAELERIRVQMAEEQDSAARIRELEDALGVKQGRPEDELNAANVIAEDTSGFKKFIAIDLGQDDGLDEGMVVLSRNGSLIGTLAMVYPDFAWVRLVTDPDSAVNAQVNAAQGEQGAQGTEGNVVTPASPTPGAPSPTAPGPTPAPVTSPQPVAPPPEPVRAVVKGELKLGMLLDLLPSGASVVDGDLVLTSGHGGNYPRGILIGTVKDVEARPQAPFKTATIEPAANLFGLDTVLVLTSFRPARLTTP
jgi:rod shape-determining protein MreC